MPDGSGTDRIRRRRRCALDVRPESGADRRRTGSSAEMQSSVPERQRCGRPATETCRRTRHRGSQYTGIHCGIRRGTCGQPAVCNGAYNRRRRPERPVRQMVRRAQLHALASDRQDTRAGRLRAHCAACRNNGVRFPHERDSFRSVQQRFRAAG